MFHCLVRVPSSFGRIVSSPITRQCNANVLICLACADAPFGERLKLTVILNIFWQFEIICSFPRARYFYILHEMRRGSCSCLFVQCCCGEDFTRAVSWYLQKCNGNLSLHAFSFCNLYMPTVLHMTSLRSTLCELLPFLKFHLLMSQRSVILIVSFCFIRACHGLKV